MENIDGNNLTNQNQCQQMNPWTAKAGEKGFDYLKLLEQFGTKPITPELIKRIETLTKMPVHTLLRRGIFFSQQDLEKFLDHYEKGQLTYIYTGRGPSSESMHLGHLVPFEFTKYLQDAFGCIVIIQMSDDEKFYFKGGKLENYRKLVRSNAKDIVAVGFNPNKTYIFSNFDEIANGNPGLHLNNVLMSNFTSINQVRAIFGLNTITLKQNEDGTIGSSADPASVGMMTWPVYQSTPAFSSSFEFIFKNKNAMCLIPMAADQAVYFRLARDFAKTVKYLKPACIHSEFLIGLGGRHSKMSSTETVKPIFLTDTKNQITDKIKKCFSGGGNTVELHKQNGANLEVDVPYQWALIFEENDDVLKHYAQQYSSGVLSTTLMKEYTGNLVLEKITRHHEAKQLVTDEVLDLFFSKKREFDLTVPTRKSEYVLLPDSEYEKQGANFDRYFGCLKKDKTIE